MAEERSAVGAAGAGASGGVARAGSITIAVAVATAGVAAVATMQVVRAIPGYSLTGDGVAGEAVVLGVAWVTCLVGAVAWRRRPKDRTGYLLYAAGVGWLAAQWATPGADAVFGRFAAPTFTTGLLLGGGMPLLVGHLALAYPGGRLRSRSRRTLVAIGLTTTVALLGIGGGTVLRPSTTGVHLPGQLAAGRG